MPRKVDPPAVAILGYFRTAPLEAAELVLSLAKAEVAGRRQAKPKKPTPAAVAKPVIPMPDPKGPPTPAAAAPRTRTRRQMHQQAVGGAKEADVPLPGLVSNVGEE